MKALQRSLDWLENPEVYAVNREEAHSSHLFYEAEEDIYAGGEMPLEERPGGTGEVALASWPNERSAEV